MNPIEILNACFDDVAERLQSGGRLILDGLSSEALPESFQEKFETAQSDLITFSCSDESDLFRMLVCTLAWHDRMGIPPRIVFYPEEYLEKGKMATLLETGARFATPVNRSLRNRGAACCYIHALCLLTQAFGGETSTWTRSWSANREFPEACFRFKACLVSVQSSKTSCEFLKPDASTCRICRFQVCDGLPLRAER